MSLISKHPPFFRVLNEGAAACRSWMPITSRAPAIKQQVPCVVELEQQLIRLRKIYSSLPPPVCDLLRSSTSSESESGDPGCPSFEHRCIVNLAKAYFPVPPPPPPAR